MKREREKEWEKIASST